MKRSDLHALLQDCRSGDPRRQISALADLLELGNESAVPAILPLLASEDEEVRAEAARVLGYLGRHECERVGSELLRLLDDEVWNVRDEAALAYALLKYAPAREGLERLLLHDPEWIVRASAAEALGNLADPATVPALEQSLLNENEMPEVQSYVAWALGECVDPAYLPRLDFFIARSKYRHVTSALLTASYKLGGRQSLQPLLDILYTADEDEAFVVLQHVQECIEYRRPVTLLEDAPRIREALLSAAQRYPLAGSHARELAEQLESPERGCPERK